MRTGLLVGGLIFLVVGILLDLTLIGALIGLPIGVIGLIMIIVGLFSSNKPQNITIQQTVGGDSKNGDVDPLSALKLRYAKGEITKKELDQMKKDLE
jgi:uncharacterized membrane protein